LEPRRSSGLENVYHELSFGNTKMKHLGGDRCVRQRQRWGSWFSESFGISWAGKEVWA
jgi:hypothetical protein